MSTARAHQTVQEVERESGIFVRKTPTAADVLLDVKSVAHSGPMAVYVAAGTGRPPSAAAAARTGSDNLGFGLGLRMNAWLAQVTKAQILTVPEYMKEWLPCARVVVIPMRTPCWAAGAIVVSADAVTKAILRELDLIGGDVALQLERDERKNSLRAYRAG